MSMSVKEAASVPHAGSRHPRAGAGIGRFSRREDGGRHPGDLSGRDDRADSPVDYFVRAQTERVQLGEQRGWGRPRDTGQLFGVHLGHDERPIAGR